MNMISDDVLVALVLSQFAYTGLNFVVNQTIGVTCHVFSRYFTTSVEIHAQGGGVSDVSSWLEEFIKHKCGEKLRHLRITNQMHLRACSHDDEYMSRDIMKLVNPLPSNWSVFFWYKRTFMRVIRKCRQDVPGQIDIFTITAYGTSNKKLLIDMLDEAKKMAEKKPEKHVNYYRAYGGSWRLIRRVQPRAMSTIILKEGVTKAILEDVEDFLENRQWYKQRGIPYRRGYLLYGPPGCGKTSFVKAVSGQIGYDIYELRLSDPHISDDSLNGLISHFGKKCILLFEDVDAAFVARLVDEERSEKAEKYNERKLQIRQPRSGVSFSGLLNAIDGVASEEDYIVFMTTNYIDKLDAALIRPGRIDMRQLIGYPDEEQIAEFFKTFYPECNDELVPEFAKAVKDLKCNPSIAQIQGIFLKHKHQPENNLTDVKSLVEVCRENVDPNHYNIYN